MENEKYYKCWKCGTACSTSLDAMCMMPFIGRTSGICGGSFNIECTYEDLKKFSLLKESPTIATDNTLSEPSHPVEQTAEEFYDKRSEEMAKESHDRTFNTIQIMEEYASLKSSQARREAIQECIELFYP